MFWCCSSFISVRWCILISVWWITWGESKFSTWPWAGVDQNAASICSGLPRCICREFNIVLRAVMQCGGALLKIKTQAEGFEASRYPGRLLFQSKCTSQQHICQSDIKSVQPACVWTLLCGDLGTRGLCLVENLQVGLKPPTWSHQQMIQALCCHNTWLNYFLSLAAEDVA